MDLVSPGSHTDHPMDLLVASAPRGGGRRLSSSAASSPSAAAVRDDPPPQQQQRPIEWRSLDLRAELAEAAPSWMHAGRRPPSGTTGLDRGCMAALELIDPSDKSCLSRLEQLMKRKSKVGSVLLLLPPAFAYVFCGSAH